LSYGSFRLRCASGDGQNPTQTHHAARIADNSLQGISQLKDSALDSFQRKTASGDFSLPGAAGEPRHAEVMRKKGKSETPLLPEQR
jgi:hypothetical protein